ncbi:DUF3800 domain-containing protein [Caballeronia sp. 15715]|uniref:DUF3800 domain-containing protein n=1 Tax=Caballeronia sp. 15715 TaxID=3391030 RepID=UPI0039E6AB6D
MHIFYIDEAGCPGLLPGVTSNVQPVLAISGVILPQVNLRRLTRDFLSLKRQFHPSAGGSAAHGLDIAKVEIKGADLRHDIRRRNRNRRRAVFGFLDKTLDILDANDAKLVSRIYIKKPGDPFKGKAVYAAAVQALCSHFQHFLTSTDSQGIVIADSRTPALNSIVSHSIFTQKFKAGGDPYDRILEMPLFGHSENHAVIQITDFLCSAMLFPMATAAYCAGHMTSVHIHPKDEDIRNRYAGRLKRLSYRYVDGAKTVGGITVIDAIGQRSASWLFRAPSAIVPWTPAVAVTSLAPAIGSIPSPVMPLVAIQSGAAPTATSLVIAPNGPPPPASA